MMTTRDFSIEKRIYYHDTDSGGVVYYANYLLFLEEGRTEYLRKNGIDTAAYMRSGIVFPVVHVEINYKSPARYGDVIGVFTRIEHVGNASVQFIQEIKRGETLLVTAKTIWACVGRDFQPVPAPDPIRNLLKK